MRTSNERRNPGMHGQQLRRRPVATLALFLSAVVAVALAPLHADNRATTIVGADLADGTGAAVRGANVRFVNDRIVGVGTLTPQRGDIVIDGKGLVVAPGFIDIHNHSAEGLTNEPVAASQVAQGITTIVVGPDGSSPWPIGEYLTQRRKNPAAVNVAVMVGHATIRRQVMGDDYKRPATAAERKLFGELLCY